jgi:hypothetical protein
MTNHILQKKNRDQIMFVRMSSTIPRISKKNQNQIEHLRDSQESMTLQMNAQYMHHMAKEGQSQVNRDYLQTMQKKTPHQIEFLRHSQQTAKDWIGEAKKKNLEQTKLLFPNSATTPKSITRLQISSPFTLSCRVRAPPGVVARLADVASRSGARQTLSRRPTSRRRPRVGAARAAHLHRTRRRARRPCRARRSRPVPNRPGSGPESKRTQGGECAPREG